MDDMSIPNHEKITPFVNYNQWLKRLDPQLNKPTIQNLLKVPKVVKLTNKKMLLQNFGDLNCPMSLSCLKEECHNNNKIFKRFFLSVKKFFILNFFIHLALYNMNQVYEPKAYLTSQLEGA